MSPIELFWTAKKDTEGSIWRKQEQQTHTNANMHLWHQQGKFHHSNKGKMKTASLSSMQLCHLECLAGSSLLELVWEKTIHIIWTNI